ncbi:MAG: hypothetical protein AAF610_11880 [Pseudomonadota bacterium]
MSLDSLIQVCRDRRKVQLARQFLLIPIVLSALGLYARHLENEAARKERRRQYCAQTQKAWAERVRLEGGILIPKLIEALLQTLPDVEYSVIENDQVLEIPATSDNIGPIRVYDGLEELTAYIGAVHHRHIGLWGEYGKTDEGRTDIAKTTAEFIAQIINEKIGFYDVPDRGGGFVDLESVDDSLEDTVGDTPVWVWSGKRAAMPWQSRVHPPSV